MRHLLLGAAVLSAAAIAFFAVSGGAHADETDPPASEALSELVFAGAPLAARNLRRSLVPTSSSSLMATVRKSGCWRCRPPPTKWKLTSQHTRWMYSAHRHRE